MDKHYEAMMREFLDYLRREKNGGLSENTIQRYQIHFDHFEKHAGKHPIELTTYAEVSSMIRAISKQRSWSSATTKMAADAASVFYAWAFRFKHIAENPLQLGHEFKRKETKQMDFFEWNDVGFKKLINNPNNSVRDNAIFHTLRSAGLRASELCALRHEDPNDVDLDGRWFHVRCGKGGRGRGVPFDAETKLWLGLYIPQLKRHSRIPALFQMHDFTAPMTPVTLYKMVARKAEKLGMKACPHMFRRSLGGEIIARGGDLTIAQQVLGHANASTTAKHYVYYKRGRLRDLYDQTLARQPVAVPGFGGN